MGEKILSKSVMLKIVEATKWRSGRRITFYRYNNVPSFPVSDNHA